ncbi:MAG: hypothetical protein ACM34K_01285 [Bacillota bacterium]
MEQNIQSLGEHTDLLLVIIGFLFTSLVALVIFIFKSVLTKQKSMETTLEDHSGKIASMGIRMDKIEVDVEKALKKSEEIEKNYIKKFDELSKEIQSLGLTLAEKFTKEVGKLYLAIEKTNTENERRFMSRSSCETMHEKLERTLEKLTERVNED